MLKWKVASKQSFGESTDGGTTVVGAGASGPVAHDLQQCLQAATADLGRISDKSRWLLTALGSLPLEQQEQAKDVVATVLGLKGQFEVIQSQVLQLLELQQKPSSSSPAQAVPQAAGGCAGSSREAQLQHDGGGGGSSGGGSSPDGAAIVTAGGSHRCVRRCKSCLSGDAAPAAAVAAVAVVRTCLGHLTRQSNVESNGKPWSRWQSASPLLSRPANGDTAAPTDKELTCRQRGDAAGGGPLSKVLVREASSSSREGTDDWDPVRTCLSNGSCGGCNVGPVVDSDDQSSMTSGWSDSSKETPSTGDGPTRCLPLHDKVTPVAQARRARVIKDFVESERKYCTVLSAIVKDYMEAPQASLEDCSEQDTRTIFPLSLKNIYKFHRKLLALLEKRAGTIKDVDVVGDVFTRFTESLDQSSVFTEYRDYIDNFPIALSTIRRLQKCSSEFRKWTKRCRRSSVLVLDLTNLLLIPVCRVPGYVSTLQQLLQFTEPEHPDAFHLRWCLPKFEVVASDLSQAIAKSVTMAKYRLSDDGIADDSVIEEESTRWTGPERTGSEDSVLVRCKDGGERRQTEEVVVLNAVAASDTSSRIGLVSGGEYHPRSYAAQSVLNGLVTLPRKQHKDRDAKWTTAPPRGIANGGHAEAGHSLGESHLRNVKVTPQGNSYCVSSSTLPRPPRRPVDSQPAAARDNSTDVNQPAATITVASGSAAMAAAAAATGSASGVRGSPRLFREKSRALRPSHHTSQFDLRHGVQSPASKSAIHRWMHASQPDLLSSKCDSLHSLAGSPSSAACERPATGIEDAGGKRQKQRKGFGALLKFFFAKKLLQKSKAASAKKGPVESAPKNGSSATLFVSRSKLGGMPANGTHLTGASSPTLERFQQLTDGSQYGYGCNAAGDAILSDLDQLDSGSAVLAASGCAAAAAVAAALPGKDNLI